MKKIIINISEHDKSLIERHLDGTGYKKLPDNTIERLEQAVVNGTEIPTIYGDLIDRNLVLDYCQRLIDCERKQGTDVMNYGQERVNQTEAIMAHVKSEFLCPTIVPKSEVKDGEWKDTCRLPSNIPKGWSWGDCREDNCPRFIEQKKDVVIHRKIVEYLKELKQLREKRPHGKWERHYSRPGVYADLFWHCSNCGYKCKEDYANIYYKYCPNCGCEMKH